MNRKLEKYEIIEEIGHGGMATVYRARDSHLDRCVALKVLHPHLQAAPEARSRFAREARSVARLHHTNILEIYDYSGEGSEHSYIASELLTGPTLKHFVEEGRHPIPAEVAACFAIEIATALGAAHEQGIVHRDVKPENVLLHEDRCVKLTDFGIAQMVDAQSFTATGQILGSPGHMAPEQVEGRDCDVRTDIFSLGTVIYYLAVGRLPFVGRNPHHVLKKIMDGDFPDPLRVRPSIGGRLRAIICKSLESVSDHRYQTAEALELDLRAFVAEIGIEDPSEMLREYLHDPVATSEKLAARAVEHLTERGERAADEGDVPGALDYFNRVLALDEGNERVLGLIERVGRRADRGRRLATAGVALGLLGFLLGAAGYGVLQGRRASQIEEATVAAAAAPPRIDAGEIVAPPATDEADPRDASEPEPEPAAPGDDRAQAIRAARPAQPVRRGPRTVVFQPVPQNVLISVDGAEPRPFGPGFRSVKLEPGTHRFKFIGGANCCVDEELTKVIPPGPGTTEIAPRLRYKPAGLYVVARNVPVSVPVQVVIADGLAEGGDREVISVPMQGLEAVVPVRIGAQGYEEHVGDARLRVDRTRRLDVELQPLPEEP